MNRAPFDPQEFALPASTFRPAPFWSLNGTLEDMHLARQIRDFQTIGFGGYFMHPRPGMRTPYLTDEWFDRVACMVRTGEELGMEPWIYDEDSYPSGFAAGKVPAANPELRKHSLCLVTPEKKRDFSCVVTEYGWWGKNPEGRVTRVDNASVADYAIIATRSNTSQSWFNRESYIDTFNPEAVRLFLELTHDQYAERFAEKFGGVIPGVFTDEPQHSPMPDSECVDSLPWSPVIPAAFRERYGYDLADKIEALFFGLPGHEAVRFDYFNLVNDLFAENCCKPMFDWCEKHGLELTGHFWEHSYPQVKGQADIIFPLKHMQRPGIDLLGRDLDKFALPDGKLPHQVGNWQMVKVAASVARQYGHERVMSETWGGCGWDQTLEEHRRTADWEMILGINHVVPHLAHYTLEGYRKCDYPISFTRALPYWREIHELNDHIARVCYALTRGDSNANIMVLHPGAHNWIHHNHPEATNRIALNLEKLCRWLVCNQYEFDFGDEPLLRDDGWVREGRIGIAGAGYETIVISETDALFSSTLERLREFADTGGCIIYHGKDRPHLLDGRADDSLQKFFTDHAQHAPDLDALGQALRAKVQRPFTLVSDARIAGTSRWDGRRLVVFLANMENADANATLDFSGQGRLILLDTLSGKTSALAPAGNGGQEYALDFPPGASRLLVFEPGSESQAEDPGTPMDPASRVDLPAGPFPFERPDPNIMLLDHCSYCLDNDPWSPVMQVEQVKRELYERFDFEYSQGIRYPREYSRYGGEGPRDTGRDLHMKFNFNIDPEVEPADIRLAMEVPDNWQVQVNGNPVDNTLDEFFMDHCFSVLLIGAYLSTGSNEITLQARVRENLDPANMFLLGDFGVRVEKGVPLIAPEPETLELGDITTQGYPFYGGRITYKIPVNLPEKADTLRVGLQPLRAPIVGCVLDDREQVNIWQAPYTAGFDDVGAGSHELKLTLYTHLKNVFGPHYTDDTRNSGGMIVCWHYNHVYDTSREQAMVISPCGIGKVAVKSATTAGS